MGELPRVSIRALGEAFEVELPASAGLKTDAAYQMAAHGPEALLLLKDGAAAGGYFAGQLTSLGMPEVFGFLLSGIRTGRLLVSRGPSRRTVTLRDGQVVFATSTESYERLGPILLRGGLVTPAQLEAALERVRPGLSLGQVLSRTKVVTPPGLYGAMTELVKEIVLGLFELGDGHFLFLEGWPPGEHSVKLPEHTRDVVLQGIARAEELARLRRTFPLSLVLGVGSAPEALGWPWLEGGELASLRGSFEGGEHAFFTEVERLVGAGALFVQPEKPAPVVPVALCQPASALDRYGELIRVICRALREAGKDLSDLRSFFSDPLPGLEQAFAGISLAEDGSLDVNRVLGNIVARDPALARALAYEALDAFLAYALFSAKNVLAPELARELGNELKRIHEGLEQ